MNIIQAAQNRYSTKVFDPSRKLSADKVDAIKELIRLSASSVNSQPWHFIIASSDKSKARIAQATQGRLAFNERKILDASHVIVFCVKTSIDESYLQALLENEDKSGRFVDDSVKETVRAGRSFFVNMHRVDLADARQWMEKQVYLSLGSLLLGAAALDIDAVPIEGFDADQLDQTLGLTEKGLASLVLVPLGYRSEEDFNARLPKSRWPVETVFTEIQ